MTRVTSCPYCQEQEEFNRVTGELGRVAPSGKACDHDSDLGEVLGELTWVRCTQPAIIVHPAFVECSMHVCDTCRPTAEEVELEGYDMRAISLSGAGDEAFCIVCYCNGRRVLAHWAVLIHHEEDARCETHCVDHELFPLPGEPQGPPQEQVR
jgi:hypothetical protein